MKSIFFPLCVLSLCVWMLGCGTGSKTTTTTPPPSGGSGGSGSGGSGGSGGGGSTTPTTVELAYVSGTNNDIYGIRVDSNNTASIVSGSPFMVPAGLDSIAVNGSLIFTSSHTNLSNGFFQTTLQAYHADANGTLTKLQSTTIDGQSYIAFDSTGQFLYVNGDSNTQGFDVDALYGYSVNQTSGALTPLAGSPWQAQGETSGPVVVAPSGAFVCAGYGMGRTNSNVFCYARHSDGTVDPASANAIIGSSVGDITQLAFSPDSSMVFASQGMGNVVYADSPTGKALSTQTSVTTSASADGVAIDASGKWVAVATSDSKVTIYQNSGGHLTMGPVISISGSAREIAFSRSGEFLFVPTSAGSNVYSLNISTGALTLLSGSPVAGGVGGLAAAQ